MSLNISVYIKVNWTIVFLDCFPLVMNALQSLNSPGTPSSKLLTNYTIRTLRTSKHPGRFPTFCYPDQKFLDIKRVPCIILPA